MQELIPLMILGSLLAILLQVSSTLRNWKTEILLIFSLGILIIASSIFFALLISTWVCFVYILAKGIISERLSKRAVLLIYTTAVVLTFLAFRLNLLPTSKTQIMGGVAIPLGFSFIMFQSIAFLRDISSGIITELPSKISFLTSSLYFPTLTTGPFCTTQHHLTQLNKIDRPSWDIFYGYSRICLGLFKFGVSSILADSEILGLMPIDWKHLEFFHPVVGLLLASLYFYTNFSGYFDMICGVSKMMGIDLPFNLKFPFLSRSMAEYWQCWHISLGVWFKNNFFFPLNYRLTKLGFSSSAATATSGFLTFLLIGFWHGLNEKFVVWAVINALMVVFVSPGSRSRLIGTPITFCIILLINGLFLSESLESYYFLLTQLTKVYNLTFSNYDIKYLILTFILLPLFFVLEKIIYNAPAQAKFFNIGIRFALSLSLLFFGFLFTGKSEDFIYMGY